MQMTWFRCSVSILLVLICSALPSPQALPYCPWPKCWTQTERIQVHPVKYVPVPPQLKGALEKGLGKDVTKAQRGFLSSCFPKWQNHRSMSFLQYPQVLKVSMESSPYFQLDCPNDVYRKVPAGMSTHVRVCFTPKENKDYSHELVCMSQRERIVVPIRAIAARAILDFPDQLDFSVCPVKYSTQKTLLVRNIGNRAAHYQLSTQSPFSVVPATGTLGAGDTMQVTVGFHPLTAGDHSGSLVVGCTGEESIHINLQGGAEDVNIGLSTYFMKVKSFVNRSNHATVFIRNSSNITAHFQWKAFPTEEFENEKKRRLCHLLQPSTKVLVETFKKEKEIEDEKGFCEDLTALLSNKVKEEMAKVQANPMLFSNDVLFIEPMEGEIGPHCLAKIKVTFKPLEPREYRCVAYCNISGRENRLPLCLRGEGQGPLVELSNDILTFWNTIVDSHHVCEVKLINKGVLDAPFTYIPSTTNVGSCFKFAPEEGIIAPGESQTIQISFNATVVGYFDEQFRFSVAGSPTPVILAICGRVHRPTLHFHTKQIDFGDVSFGFPSTRLCRLTNTSMVPVTFKLRVLDDGTQPAVSSFDQIRRDSDPSWREGLHSSVKPREFTMNPSQGIILPQTYQDIEVTLCSNTATEFKRIMLADVEGSQGKGVASLIIKGRCFAPELQVYPKILCFDDCFLKVPYEKKLFIRNNTLFPGCYGLIPQERKEDSPVFYSSPKPCGIVQPHSTAEIPLVVEAQTWGKHCTSVPIGVFGDERNPLRTELHSYGRLAEIYQCPSRINFGSIRALQPNSRGFSLFNEGLVDVDFRIEIAKKPHCYVIEPREGVIPARASVRVIITATLDDTGHFCDDIQLFIWNRLWKVYVLEGLSVGTTIVIDKPFTPEVNLGYKFSRLPFFCRFKLTNGGHHFHRLFWKVECNRPAKEKGQSTSALSSPKAEGSQRPKRTKHTRPVFELEPPLMDLQPGESVDMVLRGFSRVPQVVRDYVMCEAVIGIGNVVTKIIETTFTCEFINPSVKISARQFSFSVVKLESKEDPEDKMVRGHPSVEKITLWGEARFPNLQIQPSTLEFGCIVAGTEKEHSLEMTNCGSLPVKYHWAFQTDSQVNRSRYELQPPEFKPPQPRMSSLYLHGPATEWGRFMCRNVEELVRAPEESQDLAQSSGAEVLPHTREKRYIAPWLKRVAFFMDLGYTPLEVEKAFSILPLSGVLQPGERQQVSFTFFGHHNTIAGVRALCHVEGGPTYKVELTGEASRVSYSLSPREIDCGLQMFNEIHHSTVTLENTCKVKFNWVINPSTADRHLPGVFLVNPNFSGLRYYSLSRLFGPYIVVLIPVLSAAQNLAQ
ncbi:hypothetical protein DUI87_13912 [Hirundo rustica rustica]|uniref:HYDIN/VesB/CFA65-like Ig-like domain-containing protein n=1 Tax=Hirundo rustica rustica TaxID=333673 RepID=A0A3M0K6Z2_HIRRU|nr:hypothetical protein DUI87_13912 [Hirundo rustica rustica]